MALRNVTPLDIQPSDLLYMIPSRIDAFSGENIEQALNGLMENYETHVYIPGFRTWARIYNPDKIKEFIETHLVRMLDPKDESFNRPFTTLLKGALELGFKQKDANTEDAIVAMSRYLIRAMYGKNTALTMHPRKDYASRLGGPSEPPAEFQVRSRLHELTDYYRNWYPKVRRLKKLLEGTFINTYEATDYASALSNVVYEARVLQRSDVDYDNLLAKDMFLWAAVLTIYGVDALRRIEMPITRDNLLEAVLWDPEYRGKDLGDYPFPFPTKGKPRDLAIKAWKEIGARIVESSSPIGGGPSPSKPGGNLIAGGMRYSTLSSSTSKMSFAFGGMTLPAPRSP